MHRDRAPLDHQQLEPMMAALAHRGPDGGVVCQRPGVVLGYQHFWLTPEEQGERQPLVDPDQRLALLFDGRLDNREELLAALDRRDEQQLSDAALALLAYQRWGEHCFERFLGPFAVVIHDAVQHQVVMARDVLGDRTLFYTLDQRLLLIASEECALLTHPAVPRNVDESSICLFMALKTPEDGRTFFSAIKELPLAHVMTVDRDRIRCWRHSQVKVTDRLRYRSDEEYAEHFLELLTQSVRCRLRTATPPAVTLSGGLDSTSVAALAARELAATHRPPLRACSWVFDELKSCDERAYSETLTTLYGMETIYVRGDDCWPLQDPANWPVDPNGPYQNPYRRLKARLHHAASASGSRVLLTGVFGDHLYIGQREWLVDWLREGRWFKAGEELARQLRLNARHRFLRQGLRYLASLLLDRLPGGRYLKRRRRSAGPPPWLTPYAVSRLPAMRSENSAPALRPKQYDYLAGSYGAWNTNREIRNANQAGIDLWHPYRDRRLMEFMLAVPAYQLFSRNQNKYVLRNALRGITSEKVRTRLHPTPLVPLFARGLGERESAYVNALLHPADALWRRWVRSDWLNAVFPDRINRQMDGVELVVPWQCMTLELWLQNQPVSFADPE